MKKLTLGIIALALLSVGTVWVSAQNGGGHGFGFFGGDSSEHREQMFNRIFDRIASELKLTDAQRSQAQQVIAAAKTRIEPLTAQLKQNHEAIEKLGHDGTFNEAQVNEIATEQAATMKQLIIEKEKTKAALFAILTTEQRAQAEQMQEQFKTRMREHGFLGAISPAGL